MLSITPVGAKATDLAGDLFLFLGSWVGEHGARFLASFREESVDFLFVARREHGAAGADSDCCPGRVPGPGSEAGCSRLSFIWGFSFRSQAFRLRALRLRQCSHFWGKCASPKHGRQRGCPSLTGMASWQERHRLNPGDPGITP